MACPLFVGLSSCSFNRWVKTSTLSFVKLYLDLNSSSLYGSALISRYKRGLYGLLASNNNLAAIFNPLDKTLSEPYEMDKYCPWLS